MSPNASFSVSRLQEEIQLKEEAENNLAAFRAVSRQVPTLPGHLCPPCPLLKQPVPITEAWLWAQLCHFQPWLVVPVQPEGAYHHP